MPLELKVIEKTIGSLAINYEQLKSELALQLAKFSELTVTEEGLKEAKDTRASLNKVKGVIDDRRKELKKEFLKPYELVENQSKELCQMIDSVSSKIDVQIKAFEEAEKEEKRIKINGLWANLNFAKVELAKVFDERWLNKGYKLDQIEEEMKQRILDIEGDLDTIKSLCYEADPEKALVLQSKYLLSLDIGKVIAEYNNEMKAREIIKNGMVNNGIPTPQEIVNSCEKVESPTIPEAPKDPLFTLTFKVIASETKIRKLSQFLKENGFVYEQLDVNH